MNDSAKVSQTLLFKIKWDWKSLAQTKSQKKLTILKKLGTKDKNKGNVASFFTQYTFVVISTFKSYQERISYLEHLFSVS